MTGTGLHRLKIGKIAGAITVSFAALTMSLPAQAASNNYGYGRSHHRSAARADIRGSYASVYPPAPGVYSGPPVLFAVPPVYAAFDYVGYPGPYLPYHCGIGLFNSPLLCQLGD